MSPPQIGSEKKKKVGRPTHTCPALRSHHDPASHNAYLLQAPLLGAEGVQEAAGPHSWKLLPQCVPRSRKA